MEIQNNCCESFKNGDIIDSKEAIPTSLQKSVESIAKKEGFITHKIVSKKISTEGGNYLAALYLVDIKGKTNDGDKEVNLFVKHIIPMGEGLSGFFSISDAYNTESFVYKDLAKLFKQLEDKAGVPAEERYKIVKGFEESSAETIILENIVIKGFKTCERRQIGPLRFIELSIVQLAKFHGLGFVIEKTTPNYFKNNIKTQKYPMRFNEEWLKFYNSCANICLKGLKDHFKKKAENFLPKATLEYERYIRDSSTVRTLCHGDFRALNILMKEEDGEIKEIIPVDLQCINYGSPANDILYFIFGCTDREFRKQHMDNILDLYYDTLKNNLKYFDIDVAEVYPRSKFDAAIQERANFGLIFALGIFPFLFASEDNYPDISNDDGMKALDFELEPQILSRIEEMIEDAEIAGLL